MNKIEDFVSASHQRLVESIVSDDIDCLLLYMAMVAMKFSGHRYGSFLQAANTAAKLAVYTSYLESGRNQRKTSYMHHVEAKRVKAIVEEVEAALLEGKGLNFLGSREPQYLIEIPHVWMKLFPVLPARADSQLINLSRKDQAYVENLKPANAPCAAAITNVELLEVIQATHEKCQEDLPPESRSPLSDSMLEHMSYCLLNSETVGEVKLPDSKQTAYILLKGSYSPKTYVSRLEVAIQDTLKFFSIMKSWAQQDAAAFRALETLRLDTKMRTEAIQELDVLITRWADKYHSDQGEQRLSLVMALGTEKRVEDL